MNRNARVRRGEDGLADVGKIIVGVIIARTGLSARRITPAIMSRSPLSMTPADWASAMSDLISSSVTFASPELFDPSSPISRRLEPSSSQTKGAATLERRFIGAAMRQAMDSGFLRAICFGTSSPMMSDT